MAKATLKTYVQKKLGAKHKALSRALAVAYFKGLDKTTRDTDVVLYTSKMR